jgi:hypothetical protein
MLVHYETKGNYFVLLGVGFNLYAYSLPELITQSKKIYNINLLTALN